MHLHDPSQWPLGGDGRIFLENHNDTHRQVLGRLVSWVRCLFDHLCQKCCMRVWQSCHLQGREIPHFRNVAIRKCLGGGGVSASMPSSSCKAVSGWLFRHASICTRTVVASSKVNWLHQRWFIDFTATSHNPPKCGVCGGEWTSLYSLVGEELGNGLLSVISFQESVKLTAWDEGMLQWISHQVDS